MPIVQAVKAAETWSDGQFTPGDILAGADVGMELLGAVLDPVGAVVGQALDFLKEVVIWLAQKCGGPVEALLATPEMIQNYAEELQKRAQGQADRANAIVALADSLALWSGEVAEQYREAMRGTYNVLVNSCKANENNADVIRGVAAIVALIRELLWSVIKQALVDAISKAIIALASSWCTFGATLAAYTAWITAKWAALAAKVTGWLSKLFDKAASLFKQGSKIAKVLKGIAQRLDDISVAQIARVGQADGAAANTQQAAQNAYNSRQAASNATDPIAATHHGDQAAAAAQQAAGGYHGSRTSPPNAGPYINAGSVATDTKTGGDPSDQIEDL